MKEPILLVIAFRLSSISYAGSNWGYILNQIADHILIGFISGIFCFMYFSEDHWICNDYIVSMAELGTKKDDIMPSF
jgi:hypothetical protein